MTEPTAKRIATALERIADAFERPSASETRPVPVSIKFDAKTMGGKILRTTQHAVRAPSRTVPESGPRGK